MDIVAVDIAHPLEEQGGVVVEVNAGPGLRMHLEPSAAACPGRSARQWWDSMLPPGREADASIVAVTGVNGKTTTTRLIAHILTHAGRRRHDLTEAFTWTASGSSPAVAAGPPPAPS